MLLASLHTRLHDDGSGQCIHVIFDELLVQEIRDHHQNSGPYNHKSLQAEHGIKSLSNILSKCLTDQGQMWHKFLSLAMFAYNIFLSPNLGNYSPYELVFRRKLKLLINIETDPDIKIASMFKDDHTLLTKRLDYLQKCCRISR